MLTLANQFNIMVKKIKNKSVNISFIHVKVRITMEDLVKKYEQLYLGSTRPTISDKYILRYKGFQDLLERKSNKVHFDLLAVPYMGDLKNATWHFLMTNPGFEYMEYKEQKDDDYRKAIENNLKQIITHDNDYPCVWLNPKYSWTSGFQYWAKYLCNNKITLKKLKTLSKDVAIIQLFGYYSSSNIGFNKDEFSAYTKLSGELVNYILNRGNSKVVVSRNVAGWKKVCPQLEYHDVKLLKPSDKKISPFAPFIPPEFFEEYKFLE